LSIRILFTLLCPLIIVYTFAMSLQKVAKSIMNIFYYNGSFDGASLRGLNDFEQVRNAIIVAKCEGLPFRGRPKDMANDVIAHILNRTSSEVGLFPVIMESHSGSDSHGEYTTKVIFQAVF